MVYEDGFTDTVNYRMIVSQLKRDGHTKVPDLDVVQRIAIELDGKLAPWVAEEMERNLDDFREALEYYMANA